jgi:uncharacterized protein
MKKFLISLIKVYKELYPIRLTFMRMFGAAEQVECKFSPTCSEYAILAINKHGAIKGCGKALWRILRCNPWSKGGYDTV